MASDQQQTPPSLSSPLLTRICTFETTPPCGESIVSAHVQEAIDIISSDTQLAPENKMFVIENVLAREFKPYYYFAAKSIIEAVEQGYTASAWYCYLRQGIDYLRHAGNRRRPKDRLKKRSPIQRCEITGNDEEGLVLKGCRILPFPISNEDIDNDHLWNLLRCFWDLDTVEMIKLLCGPVSINDFVNGIVMTPVAYDSFNDLGFYLVPELGTITPNKYSAIFYWTREPERIPNFWPPERVIGDVGYFPLMNSGQRIIFESVDPVLFPLPDPGLLVVRALLARISHPAREWIDEKGGHEPIEDDQSVSTGSSFGCMGYYSSDSCPSMVPIYECAHSTRIASISVTSMGVNSGHREGSCLVCTRSFHIQNWLDSGSATSNDIESDGEDGLEECLFNLIV